MDEMANDDDRAGRAQRERFRLRELAAGPQDHHELPRVALFAAGALLYIGAMGVLVMAVSA